MGKQAKIKKNRQENQLEATNFPQPNTNLERTKFVKDMQKNGYSLPKIIRAPDIPREKNEPQV